VNKVKDCYCGAPCLFAKDGEPCWGEISAVEEVYDEAGDYYWIHACDGHVDCYHGGLYIQDKNN